MFLCKKRALIINLLDEVSLANRFYKALHNIILKCDINRPPKNYINIKKYLYYFKRTKKILSKKTIQCL